MAFCANVTVGSPEIHIAYDASAGVARREFLEVFIPDERGLPAEGRLTSPAEFTAVFEALTQSPEAERIGRALYQYEVALRHWYFGGEWLALSHLYMAVEALTPSELRRECSAQGIEPDELADRNGINTNEPRWRAALDSWCREALIFEGDSATYGEAKSASDGVEHGFMELSEVHRRAVQVTEDAFGYVRRSILRQLGLSGAEHEKLAARSSRDVGSLRKVVRGHFNSDSGNVAPNGEEYPYLEWRSKVKTLRRDGKGFDLSFEENFTVRCAPEASFAGQSFEMRGRKKPGEEPIVSDAVTELHVTPAEAGRSRAKTMELMARVGAFAAKAAAVSGGVSGFPPMKAPAYGAFGQQVALYEAITELLRTDRSIEAIMLLERLMLGACRLEAMADPVSGLGWIIRTRLDAIERQGTLFGDSAEIRTGLEKSSSQLREQATQNGITLPVGSFPYSETAFYRNNTKEMEFAREVAAADDLSVSLHSSRDNDVLRIRTQVSDESLTAGVAGAAMNSLLASASALARIFDLEYDQGASDELDRAVQELAGD
jgi:hypothetical protein